MGRMTAVNLHQAVAHEELVVACSKNGGGDVDEDGDPRVAVVEGEGLAAEEDGRHQPRAQVPRQVRRDRVRREAPDHRRVREPDREGHAHRADERVGGVQARPCCG